MQIKISIVSVGIDSPEWAELFIKSIWKFTTISHEIIIIDNNSLSENLIWLRGQQDIRLIENEINRGHGGAMDQAVLLARGEYVCIFDIDSHVQRKNWDRDLLSVYNRNKKIRLIGCVGPEHKPLHPPLFFFKKQFILDNCLSFLHIPGITSDTAQKIYWDIKALGFKIVRLSPSKKIYNCKGDQFWLEERPTFWHGWYGTRFCHNHPIRRKKTIDGRHIEDFLANLKRLFNEPGVKEIMAYRKRKRA